MTGQHKIRLSGHLFYGGNIISKTVSRYFYDDIDHFFIDIGDRVKDTIYVKSDIRFIPTRIQLTNSRSSSTLLSEIRDRGLIVQIERFAEIALRLITVDST